MNKISKFASVILMYNIKKALRHNSNWLTFRWYQQTCKTCKESQPCSIYSKVCNSYAADKLILTPPSQPYIVSQKNEHCLLKNKLTKYVNLFMEFKSISFATIWIYNPKKTFSYRHLNAKKRIQDKNIYWLRLLSSGA